MKLNGLVGPHLGGGGNLTHLDEFYAAGSRAFQFFASNPKSADSPFVRGEIQYFCNKHPDVRPVFHSPYWVSICNPATYGYNMLHIWGLVKQCRDSHLDIHYVTHIGYPSKEDNDVDKVVDNAVTFLRKLLSNIPLEARFTIYLEVSAGHKHWVQYDTLDNLVRIVQRLGDSRVKICLDTEHHYANGSDVPAMDAFAWNYIGLVHLNAVPEYVEAGSHKDRHSETKLRESKTGMQVVQHYLIECIKRNIPMILERYDAGIMLDDISFCEEIPDGHAG